MWNMVKKMRGLSYSLLEGIETIYLLIGVPIILLFIVIISTPIDFFIDKVVRNVKGSWGKWL